MPAGGEKRLDKRRRGLGQDAVFVGTDELGGKGDDDGECKGSKEGADEGAGGMDVGPLKENRKMLGAGREKHAVAVHIVVIHVVHAGSLVVAGVRHVVVHAAVHPVVAIVFSFTEQE